MAFSILVSGSKAKVCMWSPQCASRGDTGSAWGSGASNSAGGTPRLPDCMRERSRRAQDELGIRVQLPVRVHARAPSGEHRDCLAGIAVRKLDRPWKGVRPLRVQFEAQVSARSHASPTSTCSTLLYSTLPFFTFTFYFNVYAKHLPPLHRYYSGASARQCRSKHGFGLRSRGGPTPVDNRQRYSTTYSTLLYCGAVL